MGSPFQTIMAYRIVPCVELELQQVRTVRMPRRIQRKPKEAIYFCSSWSLCGADYIQLPDSREPEASVVTIAQLLLKSDKSPRLLPVSDVSTIILRNNRYL
jgi:hypothetical protein